MLCERKFYQHSNLNDIVKFQHQSWSEPIECDFKEILLHETLMERYAHNAK